MNTIETIIENDDNFAEDVVAFWERIGKMENPVSMEPKEDTVSEWWEFFDNATNEEEKYQNYTNCLYQINGRQYLWTEEEIACFKENIREYEKSSSYNKDDESDKIECFNEHVDDYWSEYNKSPV